MTQRIAHFSIIVAFGLVVARSGDARAQAWVDDKGALDVSLSYNLGISDQVIGDSSIPPAPNAGTTTQLITMGAEYVPMPRLAIDVGLPLAILKYTGDKTLYDHPGGGAYDDGNMHATLTDLRAGARYQVLEEPFALSALLAVSIPVQDYETVGNAVPGRHLKALHIGAAMGRLIGESLYVHLLYEFSLVEKYDRTPNTAKYSQNHSDAALTIGYSLLENRLDLNVGANMRIGHGGIAFSDFLNLEPDEQLYHDAILKEDILLIGGGVGYQITNDISVSLAAKLFVTGTNTQNANLFALGLGWRTL